MSKPKQWGRVSVSRNIFNAICGEDFVFEAAVLFKFRRWKGSAWKHELCYKESMWSAFWSGVWQFCTFLFWPQWGKKSR